MQERYDIKYRPLFNQAEPGIWEKFMEIEVNARAAEGCPFKDSDFEEILCRYHQEWEEPNNIAFGAFLDGEMVGFAKGHMIEHLKYEYKLVSLFVRHDMQRQGIGRKLIMNFENSVALNGSYVQGQCFEWAIPFYKKQGYTVIRGIKPCPEMNKELKKLGKGVYPMFSKWQFKDIKPKISAVPVDKKLLRDSLHQPLFVNINDKGEIDVVGFKNKDDVDMVWVSDKIPESIRKCREMSVRWQLNAVKSR